MPGAISAPCVLPRAEHLDWASAPGKDSLQSASKEPNTAQRRREDQRMPKMPPEWYLPEVEMARLRQLEFAIASKRRRHAELVAKLKARQPLTEDEREELWEVTTAHTAFVKERDGLLARNPLLPQNLISKEVTAPRRTTTTVAQLRARVKKAK
jgi:hypothetical protein